MRRILLFVLFVFCACECQEMTGTVPFFAVNERRVSKLFDTLKLYGSEGGANKRVAFSKHDVEARKFVIHLLEKKLGLKVNIDAAGTLTSFPTNTNFF